LFNFRRSYASSIPDETTVHTIQGEKVTEPLRSTNSCLRPLIDFSKTGRGAIRVAVFYTIVFCAYHATNWVRERFFGIRPSHEEARAFWYDMLIMGIVIELANKAEGDCGIFNELPSQIPLLN